MTAPDKILMILGIVLFVVLLVVLFIQVKRDKPIIALLTFFILPIAMIGFSQIQTLKVGGGEIDMKGITDLSSDPTNTEKLAAFNLNLDQIRQARAANPTAPVSAQIRTNLAATINVLTNHSHLTPASRLALSRAEWFLGRTNDAVKTARLAINANTNLFQDLDPGLKSLVKLHR